MQTSRLATFGAAIGDPARAEIVAMLGSGSRHTAGELARHLGLAPSTTSRHLGVLVDAGIIDVEPSGRHRYFGLASTEVADVIETIDALDLVETNPPRRPAPEAPLRLARSCYDHLAGRLGVDLALAMVEGGILEAPDLSITPAGRDRLGALGIDIAALDKRRRPLTRPCLDWTERTHHLGGAVGASLLSLMLNQRWLTRNRIQRRVLRVTRTGSEMLEGAFGLGIS